MRDENDPDKSDRGVPSPSSAFGGISVARGRSTAVISNDDMSGFALAED